MKRNIAIYQNNTIKLVIKKDYVNEMMRNDKNTACIKAAYRKRVITTPGSIQLRTQFLTWCKQVWIDVQNKSWSVTPARTDKIILTGLQICLLRKYLACYNGYYRKQSFPSGLYSIRVTKEYKRHYMRSLNKRNVKKRIIKYAPYFIDEL